MKRIGFRLEECAIYDFVGEIFVQQRHNIECLHHIGAVCAGERNIAGEVDGAFESLDATCHSFVRESFTLAVSVVNGNDERSKFVSARDATEDDTCVFAVFHQHHAECSGSFYYFDSNVVGGRSKVIEKFFEFCKTLVSGIGFKTQNILRFQSSINTFYLLEKAWFNHNLFRKKGIVIEV